MKYFAMGGNKVLVDGDNSSVVGGVSRTYTQDGEIHPSMSVSITSMPLLPRTSHHKSSIYLDSHPPTFPPYYSSLVRDRQMTPPLIKVYLESKMNFKSFWVGFGLGHVYYCCSKWDPEPRRNLNQQWFSWVSYSMLVKAGHGTSRFYHGYSSH